jgi:hypothetical protein
MSGFGPKQSRAGALRGVRTQGRRRSGSDNPRLGGKAPNRIKPVDVVDRTSLHVRRILAFAQCRRDARHHCRPDAADITLGSAMNMAAENGDDPPRVLQSPG